MNKYLSHLAAAVSASGCACSSFAWTRDPPPSDSSFQVGATRFHLYGDLDSRRGDHLERALAETLAILADPDFARLVSAAGVADRSIVDGYLTGHCEVERRSRSGDGLPADILEAVTRVHPSVSAWPNGYALLPGTTVVATTRRGHSPAISIDPERVDMWRGDIVQRSCLIDTLAHEMTHLIDGASGDTAYVDATQEGRPYMVSYRVGRLAACYYRRRSSSAPTDECIEASLIEPTCRPALR